MLYFGPGKKLLIAMVVLLGLAATLPNFFYETVRASNDARVEIEERERDGRSVPDELTAQADEWPSFLPSGLVNLGLDLQGGSHYLFEIELEEAYRDRMESLRRTVGQTIRMAGVQNHGRPRLLADNTVTVRITDAADVDVAREALEELAQPIGFEFGGVLTGGVDLEVFDIGDQTLQLAMTEPAQRLMAETISAAAIEVIRSRIDAYGVREPTIQRQGERRILMQLPGAEIDPDAVTQVAKLTFQMVAENVTLADIANGAIPPDVEVLEYDADLNPEFAGQTIAVFREIRITGDQLAEAQQGFDQNGLVGVNIRFTPTGARTFGEITSANLNRRFAMVLDGQVLSAPVIQARILDGRAIITGDFSVQSARELAVNLQSGNLPTEITVEESSFVGPELGADSIEAGRIACIVGFIAVLIFMMLSYGMFGVFANIALTINVFLIFGALSAFGATLTLPGIAGVVLTIGMAVDANVLIFERIREEIRRGRNVAQAIETGYERAFSAIIDANVTTFIAALILFSIGAGPIRGFAVTLGVGIVTSVFTAVMLTRFFVATWYGWARPKQLAL